MPGSNVLSLFMTGSDRQFRCIHELDSLYSGGIDGALL